MIVLLRNPVRPVLISTLVISTLILCGYLLDIVLSRSQELEVGKQRLTHMTELIAEHTSRSLEAVDILLRELATDLSGTPDWQHWSPETGFEYLSMHHTRSLPQLRDLIIFNRAGNQTFISTQFPPNQINVRDRPYFISLERGADFAMYGPYIGRNSGRYTYALARRLKGKQHEFTGAIFAAIEPAYFQDFCWSIRLSDDFESVLVNTLGRIVASCRPTDLTRQSPLIGANFSDVLADGNLRSPQHSDRNSNHADWVVSEAAVTGFPDLRVMTLIPEATLLQHWSIRLRDYIVIASLCLLVLTLWGWLLLHYRHMLGQVNLKLITDRISLETKLDESAEQLQRQKTEAECANAAKNRFLAAASHDLRQPLHALSLFTSDLHRQIRLNKNEQLPQLAQQIQASTEVLSELLDSLLDISRLDVAGITPQLRHHPIKEIFDRLSTTFNRAALAKNVHLRFKDHSLSLYSDAALLERLLANLISNSLRYTDTGGVLVSARRRGDNVLVEVRDSGIGIPIEHQQAIFIEFYQINNAARESHKGLGLGLSIVDRLARALGIKIELRSRVGKGTCFGLTLPLGEPNRKVYPHLNAPPRPPKGPSIYIIGESLALTEVAGLIKNWGYPIYCEYQIKSPPQIMIADAGLAEKLMELFPSVPLLALGHEGDFTSATIHRLSLPIRPARLRALLSRLEEEITAESHNEPPSLAPESDWIRPVP